MQRVNKHCKTVTYLEQPISRNPHSKKKKHVVRNIVPDLLSNDGCLIQFDINLRERGCSDKCKRIIDLTSLGEMLFVIRRPSCWMPSIHELANVQNHISKMGERKYEICSAVKVFKIIIETMYSSQCHKTPV